jgi:hypothetical protein
MRNDLYRFNFSLAETAQSQPSPPYPPSSTSATSSPDPPFALAFGHVMRDIE